jgi:HK97 family phage portal protein
MSIFFRSRAPEVRAVTSLPWSHGGPLKGSDSVESQLSLVPVYAATRLIADGVSTLPLDQFRRTPTGRVSMPLVSAFSRPMAGTQVDWLGRCIMSLLLRGNAFGLRIGPGATPDAVEWLHPDKVSRHEGRWYYNGAPLEDAELVHIPAMVVPGQAEGLSPLGACSATVKTGLETQRFVKDWYRNRAIPGMVFKNTQRIVNPEAAQKAKERLKATMQAGEPFVTGKDWDLEVLKLSADDAGFVAASKLTATQIANIYGVPPEMVGGETGTSLTYSTTEQQQIQFVTHTLRPWLVRLEAAFSALLPDDQFVRFNVDALIRVDTKTRYEVHQIARTIGLNSVDELRTLEDMSAVPDGKGQDFAPLGSAQGDSAARLIQQMYLGVGKVVTAKEARLILKAAGAEIDETVTLDELHESLPPMPEPNESAPKENP